MMDLDNKVILVSKRQIDDEGLESFDTFFGKVKHFNENIVNVVRPNGQGGDVVELLRTGWLEAAGLRCKPVRVMDGLAVISMWRHRKCHCNCQRAAERHRRLLEKTAYHHC